MVSHLVRVVRVRVRLRVRVRVRVRVEGKEMLSGCDRLIIEQPRS